MYTNYTILVLVCQVNYPNAIANATAELSAAAFANAVVAKVVLLTVAACVVPVTALDNVPPLITGLVNVLFVSVSVLEVLIAPMSDNNSAALRPSKVLPSTFKKSLSEKEPSLALATVPVSCVATIDLFVSVCVA